MIKLSENEKGMIKKIGALLKKLSLIINTENKPEKNKSLDAKSKITMYRTQKEQDIFDNDGI